MATDPTPEDRAAAITAGWRSVEVAIEWLGPPSKRPPSGTAHVGGHMVYAVTQQIADAIREAVLADREARRASLDPGAGGGGGALDPVRQGAG